LVDIKPNKSGGYVDAIEKHQQFHCVKEYGTHSITNPLCKGVWYTLNNESIV